MLVGILSLEGGLFRQIIPVALAGVLAGWEALAPGGSPASRVVRRFGRPPVSFVTAAEVRWGQGILAALCVVAVLCAASGAAALAWVLAIAAGILGIAAFVVGRPTLGIRPRSGPPTH